jgi:hypothetical protein
LIKATLRAAAPLRVSSLRCGPLRGGHGNPGVDHPAEVLVEV